MTQAYMLRRRKLSRTSCREISRYSTSNIETWRNDGRKLNVEVGTYKAKWGYGLPEEAEFVFRYGCTSPVPGTPKIINEAGAIHEVNDKGNFRKRTADAGLAPRTWLSVSSALVDPYFWGITAVVRPTVHAQGRHLDVCRTANELKASCQRFGSYYISELIDKVAEYRVFITCGRVVWVAKKTPGNPDQVAWNVAQGGRFDNVKWSEWPMKVIENAVRAYSLSGLHFGGVDVMVDAADYAYCLEINSAPSQTSPYRQECTAKSFDYIVNHGADIIPLGDNSDWKSYIHPALHEGAVVADTNLAAA